MLDLNQIDEYFPMKQYRPGQRECIETILTHFNNGCKTIILEAPTGSGKSAIGYTIAQFFRDSYYITPVKVLQDQLSVDFSETDKHIKTTPMIELKGRNAYICKYPEEFGGKPISTTYCDDGECHRQGESKLDCCMEKRICLYYNQVYKAMESKICLMNFSSFLFQTMLPMRFGKRELLIIDEGHETEDTLMKFVEISISDFILHKNGIILPQKETVQEYLNYFDEIDLVGILGRKVQEAKLDNNIKLENDLNKILMNLRILRKLDLQYWISEYKVNKNNTHTVSLKPLFIDEFAKQYVFNLAEHILIMSATILNKKVICNSLGINQDESKFIAVGSYFPKENRPIYYKPSGSMSFKNKVNTIPILLKDVEKICNEHNNERGIIHTHNFEIANYILENCSKKLKDRLIFQKDLGINDDKKIMLQLHSQKSDSILIAPAMHIGLDLKDDLGRFQIICKVPYPSLADKQIAARLEIDHDFYDYRVALKISQCYGRIIRHQDDYGKTYILDQDFRWFYKKSSNMLPKWFTEAIIWQ